MSYTRSIGKRDYSDLLIWQMAPKGAGKYIKSDIYDIQILKILLRTILKKSLKFYQTFLYLSNSAILSIWQTLKPK